MFVPLCTPIGGVRGKYKADNFVLFRRNNRQFLRRYTPPADPASSQHIVLRQRFRNAGLNWSRNLTPAQREGWKQWALRHTKPRCIDNQAGFNAFLPVELNRMALGLPPATEPPRKGVPGSCLELEQLSVEEP